MTPAVKNLFSALLLGQDVIYTKSGVTINGEMQPSHVARCIEAASEQFDLGPVNGSGSRVVHLSRDGLWNLVDIGMVRVDATLKGASTIGFQVIDPYFSTDAPLLPKTGLVEIAFVKWISEGLGGMKPRYVLHYDGAGRYLVRTSS